MAKSANKYDQIIAKVFFDNFKGNTDSVSFDREELVSSAEHLSIPRIKNLGDIVYSYRFRKKLPKSIVDTQPAGFE